MTWDWLKRVSEAELQSAQKAMITNKVAGDKLPINKWRYSLIGSVIYTFLRITIYCIRHPIHVKSLQSEPARPFYIYFNSTTQNALARAETDFPGDVIGFKGRNCSNYPLKKIWLATLFCFRASSVWKWIFKETRWRPWLSDVLFYIFTYRWAEANFSNNIPRTMIYSNDHCCFDRGIVDALSHSAYVTIYIQHGPITEIFPPLSATYSLLDGMRSLQTYVSIEGSKGVALICGRQYEIAGIRTRRQFSRSALICASTIDNLDSWKSVMLAVQAAGYSVTLRNHPSERKIRAWKRLADELGVVWQDALQTGLVSALEHCSVVFAGQSGVLLEAAISGAIPILIQFPEDTARGLHDYYGFANAGIARLASPGEVNQLLARLEAGQTLVAPFDIARFDIAYATNENMQLKALKTILHSPSGSTNWLREGFDPVELPGNNCLELFAPTKVVQGAQSPGKLHGKSAGGL